MEVDDTLGGAPVASLSPVCRRDLRDISASLHGISSAMEVRASHTVDSSRTHAVGETKADVSGSASTARLVEDDDCAVDGGGAAASHVVGDMCGPVQVGSCVDDRQLSCQEETSTSSVEKLKVSYFLSRLSLALVSV